MLAHCDYLPGLVAGGDEEFFELAFSLLIRFMRQRARLLFDIASEQESCLFRLFDPGVFAGKHRFYRDRCLPVSNALKLLSDINPRAIETVFEIINDFAPSAIRTFLITVYLI